MNRGLSTFLSINFCFASADLFTAFSAAIAISFAFCPSDFTATLDTSTSALFADVLIVFQVYLKPLVFDYFP